MKKSRLFVLMIAVLLTVSAFAGCATAAPTAAPTTAPAATTAAATDGAATAPATAAAATAAPAAEVKTIIIGTGNAFKPYCYLDENGNLQGYEKAVLDAVNAKLPQYKFEYQTFDFKNVLISLDAKKIDIGAHQFEVNPERQAKFLYASESYTTFILRIVVKKGRTDIHSLADLAGKKLQVGEGGNDSYVVGEYNKANGNKINVITSSADQATTVKNLENGTIDAFISIKRIVESLNKTYGDVLETVGDPIASSSTYFIYRKDETQLQQDVDKALKELKADGTLSKISIEILGGDFTTND
jgi:L-cystine transport system substrate-binding protein